MSENFESEAPVDSIKSRQRDFFKNSRRGELISSIQSNRFADEDQELLKKVDFIATHLEVYKDEKLRHNILIWLQMKAEPAQMDQFLEMIADQRIEANHYGIIGLRMLLVSDPEKQIQYIIDRNMLHKIMQLAKKDAYPHLVLEATWCLANLCSGTHQQLDFLIQKNLIPLLVDESQNPYAQIAEQALWGLGNIACDSPQTQRKIATQEIFRLLRATYNRGNPTLCKLICWIFSSICRLRNSKESIKPLEIPVATLRDEICNPENLDVVQLNDCFVGLMGCIKRENCALFKNKPEFFTKLMSFFRYNIERPNEGELHISAAIYIFGGLTNSDDSFSIELISHGALTDIVHCLMHLPSEQQKKDICWILCNIALSGIESIRAFVKEPGLIDIIFRFADESSPEIMKEASWIICNLCKAKDQEILLELINRGLFEMFSKAFDRDPSYATLVLEAIYVLLDYFLSINTLPDVTRLMISKGVAQKLVSQQEDFDISLYHLSRRILLRFFELQI